MRRSSHAWLALPLLIAVPGAASAVVLGARELEVSGDGGRFPDAAFDPMNDRYLVVWSDYGQSPSRVCGRFADPAGAPVGDVFCISDGRSPAALFPAVAYNATDREFMITWDDERPGANGVVHGQRVRAGDGTLLGANFPVGASQSSIRTGIAWGSARNEYLVVYAAGVALETMAQRLSATGAPVGSELNLSNDPGVFSGLPAVAYSPRRDRFLVTWDHDDATIRGRVVDAATGAPVAGTITVSDRPSDRSNSAYDPVADRWLVASNFHGMATSYDQYGDFIGGDGSRAPSHLPLADAPYFEGDTQFGGDVAFAPGTRTFFASYATDMNDVGGMAGQELDANGARIGRPVVLGSGTYFSLSNAVDTTRNRFLTVWEGMVGRTFRVHTRVFASDAPVVGGPDGGTTGADAAAGDGGPGPDGGDGARADATGGGRVDSGNRDGGPVVIESTACGCRTVRARAPAPCWLLAAPALAALTRRRRGRNR